MNAWCAATHPIVLFEAEAGGSVGAVGPCYRIDGWGEGLTGVKCLTGLKSLNNS